MSNEQVFLDNLKLIEDVITRIGRHHVATDDEMAEFRSLAHLKLIEHDYRVLRDYRGQSTLRTYLARVLERVFLDYRIGKWGKWRPSMDARALGQVAVRLELLTRRDHHTFDEAVQILQINCHAEETRDELWAIAERLPVRVDRRPHGEEALAYLPDHAPLPDAALVGAEEEAERQKDCSALRRVLLRLKPPDRLVVQLLFYDGMKQVDVARALHVDPKHFYRRCKRILKELKRLLRVEGIDPPFPGFK